ncbi:hypothetical protein HMPREF9714_01340 [Myroides odoratimimus CCUG 12901]|uniref:Uncharacterized protein n=1 Tax=Myroides marinus TaxID=703342 RepID=A0A1H6W680_9FLAO|nr:hypothetical protein HMPREF9714_01340 [Myroides odoratimimus CCUG 12901]SEJ12413.1 hypothetical protein SAMN04488018_1133 [Myroides marinus]SHM20804.1 hypothetical protein SAMN05444275_11047 [Myroides odoratimimus subsp. xuanwuensis]
MFEQFKTTMCVRWRGGGKTHFIAQKNHFSKILKWFKGGFINFKGFYSTLLFKS